MFSSTPLLCKKKKITMEDLKKIEQIKVLAQQEQFAALKKSKTEAERIQHAFKALHYGVQLQRAGEVQEINTLFENSKEIFGSKVIRDGVRKKYLDIKKNKEIKAHTIKSKAFKDLKRLVLAEGKLVQASELILSNTEKQQAKGCIAYTNALKKIDKVNHEPSRKRKRQIAEEMYINLGLKAHNKNMNLSNFLTEVNTIKQNF
jgi:hypothetical protein